MRTINEVINDLPVDNNLITGISEGLLLTLANMAKKFNRKDPHKYFSLLVERAFSAYKFINTHSCENYKDKNT